MTFPRERSGDGLQYGWAAADQYNDSGFIYYPMEFAWTEEGMGGSYIYCGGAGNEADSVVTTEDNGWLIRKEGIITNESGSEFTLDNFTGFQ